MENGAVMAGQIAALIIKEQSALEIIDGVLNGARCCMKRMGEIRI